MFDMDDSCYSGIKFVALAALSRLGNYRNEDGKIEDYINESLDRVEGGIKLVGEEILTTALTNGFDVHEIVTDAANPDDRTQWLADLQPVNPGYLYFDLFTDGPQRNRIQAVKQFNVFLGNPMDPFPSVNKFVIFTNEGQFITLTAGAG